MSSDEKDLLKIDKGKCIKCGKCTDVCQIHYLELDENGHPQIVDDESRHCIKCGHCVSVCPVAALDNKYVPLEKSPSLRKDLIINADQAEQFLRMNRSVRFFKDKPVEKEKLEKLIDVAKNAPTGANLQEVEWTVVQSKENVTKTKEKVVDYLRSCGPDYNNGVQYMAAQNYDRGFDTVFYDAPVLITAKSPDIDVTGRVNLSIALTYLDLYAQAMGLGVCWAGFLSLALTESKELREMNKIPDNFPNYYSVMLGYPSDDLKFYRMPYRHDAPIDFV